MSVKIVMYVVFFTNQNPSFQIVIPKGKSVNAKFCKGKVLHNLKKLVRGVRVLHVDSSHKAAIVREYLKQGKLVKVPHLLYSADLAPCVFFYFRG